MKKRLTYILALVLACVILLCVLPMAVSAASNSITYTWQGRNAYDAGFAQGNITVSVDGSSGGTYYLYWADNSAALDGFYPICKLSIANSGSASFSMPENTAIPAKATRVLAFKTSGAEPSNRSISAAKINYTLPTDKAPYKTDADLLYSFASYSDIHITSNENGAQGQKYPYDEEHLADAFRTAAARDVDFIVTTGDHVTNHRNDETGRGNPHYPEEWATYLKILAASDYVNPIYEAIGNHELWNYEDESSRKATDAETGSRYFRAMTGLDSSAATMNEGKSYYEITEPVTGDHFLFMAQEGGFYTEAYNQFTDEQLAWLEDRLNVYENDGKNVFIMEHANFDSWGAGDKIPNPIYDIPLKFSCSATTQLKTILTQHKNAVLLCGHTHFQFSLGQTYNNINYSNNDRSSATIIHNSSVGAIRNIQNGTTRVNDTSRAGTEGYIVEVYDNATVFQGTNLYENRIYPAATYIVPQRTSKIAQPTEAPAPTQAPTQAPSTEAPTDPPVPTEPPVEILCGDADDDGDVSILDVTYVQRYEANIALPSPLNESNADVDADEEVTIIDATLIQRYLVGILDRFPAEEYTAGKELNITVVGSGVELVPAGADLTTLRTQAKTNLDHYWLLSSYDQYQALKKAYHTNADYSTLNAAYNAFNTAIDEFYPGDEIDIYFDKPSDWSSVNIYCTAGSGKAKNHAWPGVAVTESSGNRYHCTVPTSQYYMVIFNNGSGKQTIDLPLGAIRDQGYKIDSKLGLDSQNHYRCSYFVKQ